MNMIGYFPGKHTRWSTEMQLNVSPSPGCETRSDSNKSTQLQELARILAIIGALLSRVLTVKALIRVCG